MNFATWNMQGATGDSESKWRGSISPLFTKYGLNLVCLQECGLPPPSAQDLGTVLWLTKKYPDKYGYYRYNLGTTSSPDYYYILICLTAQRTSLGIVTHEYEPKYFYCIANTEKYESARPAIGVQLNVGPVFYTIHAISPKGPNAPSLLNEVATEMTERKEFWVAAGDFNRQPSDWKASDVPAGVRLLDHDDKATHPSSKHNLDYAFHNYSEDPQRGIVDTDFVVSDHFPVIYAF